ncbi:oocyte zinc finger protein XlCOF7.1-like [Pseudophryne corroboree]|uniref:oocyte zinc finger protein XlCOF7.1-like n=1 Tax=Pseudophryne corroboree TaxID=495146 RepID=UPI003081ECDE
MDNTWNEVTWRILRFTMDIISLLMREDNIVVRKSGGRVIIEPYPRSLAHERDDDQKILELINKIIQLLTGEESAMKKTDDCKDKTMDSSHARWAVGGSDTSLGFCSLTSSWKSSKQDTNVHEDHLRGFIWKDSTSCEKPQISLRDESMENLTDGDTKVLPTIYTQEDYSSINIKVESISDEDLTDSDICTPTDPTHNKEDPAPCDGGSLTDSSIYIPTGHTLFSSINIKEESASGMQESLTDNDYTSVRIKEESSSCEDADIYSPSDHSPSGSNQRKPGRKLNASQIVEPNAEGLYSCTDCKKSYTTNSRLIKHQRVHKTKTIPCPQCGKHFSCHSALTRHQTAHRVEKAFICPDCGKCMSSKPALTVHQRIHKEEKPFKCSDCGRHVLFRSHLVRHQIKHSGEKPFSCSECGKSYSSKAAIVMHQRLHTGDALYPCTECGKCFVQRNHLQQHLNIHTGEKPYACPQCGKRFIQKSNLKQHMNVHVPKKKETFPCPECSKCYKRKADFKWHMLIHLGEK